MFIGHLLVEKLLKAYYSKEINITAPYIHDLVKIATLANIDLTEDQKDLLDEISTFNIKGRYPDYKDRFRKKATKEFTEGYINKIERIRIWLREMI